MKFSIIIPCYNEEGSIRKVIRSLPPQINEIIVIDNNSQDNTSRIAKKAGAKVFFEPRKGYGAALKTGFKYATGNIIITFDGDSQHPSGKILPMIRYLEEKKLDFVSGNRFPLEFPSMSVMRIIGNRFLTFVVNFLFELSLKDSQTGMWVFKRRVLDEITLESDDMALSEEIKIKVASHPRLKFDEYHIPYHSRIGSSKLSLLKHGLINLLFLFRLRLRNILLILIKSLHAQFVFSRRTEVLSRLIVNLLPDQGKILDIGCGDGTIDRKIREKRPYIDIVGIEVFKRDDALMPISVFDGKTIPHPDNSFDCVMIIDTLHHTKNHLSLLKEAARVSRKYIIIKDHQFKTVMGRTILKAMDWVGNKPQGVLLPYNFLSAQEWEKLWEKNGLKVKEYITNLGLYPFPFSFLLDYPYNFIVKLEKTVSQRGKN